MKIIAGLGNPGPRYETTRHNAGFLAVDRLIDEWKARGPNKKFNAEIYECEFAGEKILLVKPQDYMNNSGQTVGPMMGFYKLTPEDLIVIHDELDLEPGMIRIKSGGGAGGHNGIKSIDENMGAGKTGYHRIRIGIGKPTQGPGADWVLHPFSNEELQTLDSLLDQVVEASGLLVQKKVNEAMNRFNRRQKPPTETES